MNKIDGGHVCEWNSDVYTFLILLWIVNYVLNTKKFFKKLLLSLVSILEINSASNLALFFFCKIFLAKNWLFLNIKILRSQDTLVFHMAVSSFVHIPGILFPLFLCLP